jgi:hypothetical protein
MVSIMFADEFPNALTIRVGHLRSRLDVLRTAFPGSMTGDRAQRPAQFLSRICQRVAFFDSMSYWDSIEPAK